MGYKATGTICDKHDAAYQFADKAKDLLDDLMTAIEKAKEDGIKMEGGLDAKRERIKELEDEVSDLKDKIADLEGQLNDIATATP